MVIFVRRNLNQESAVRLGLGWGYVRVRVGLGKDKPRSGKCNAVANDANKNTAVTTLYLHA